MIGSSDLRDVLRQMLDEAAKGGVRVEQWVDRIALLAEPAPQERIDLVASARVALLDALAQGSYGDPGLMLQRAHVFATLASVEQARVSNLIAWKQLQTTRQASADQGVGIPALGSGDAVADEIERALGIQTTAPTDGGDL
jgi:hypothetical protein